MGYNKSREREDYKMDIMKELAKLGLASLEMDEDEEEEDEE